MPIDKTKLYRTFEKSLRRSERLNDLATRKALDLPLDEDMQIITNNTRQGLSMAGMLLLSAVMLTGGGGAAWGLLTMLNNRGQPAAEVAGESPATQEFEVTFWSEDGQQLEVTESE